MTDRIKHLECILFEAGQILLEQDIMVNCHKTKNDLLTENDISIEKFVVSEITKFDPSASIVSEETYANGNLSGRCYIIDPIDGTCNFASGLSLYGIQVAYSEDGIIKASVLHYPATKDTITALNGDGTYLNGKRVSVDVSAEAQDGFLIISDYYDDVDTPMTKQFELIQALQSSFLKTRHFGAACIDFSMLVKRNAVAYICYYSKVWDIAPGLLAALEADCVCSALDGTPYKLGNSGLVVANNEKTLRLILKKYSEI